MATDTETSFLTKVPEEMIQIDDAHKTPYWTKVKGYLRKDALMYLILVGIVVGFGVGFGVRQLNPSKDAIMWMGIAGELFMRSLRLMILPLIVCCLISGTASLDPKSNGKISLTAFVYIVSTNALGIAVGVVVGVLIRPGVGTTSAERVNTTDSMETQDIFADLLRNIVPDNMVEATFKQVITKYSREIIHTERNTTNGTVIDSLVVVSKSLGKVDSVNVLGLIAICTVLGVATNSVKEKADVVLRFFVGFTEIVFVIMKKIFWFAPIGIGSLIASAIAGITDITEAFSRLGLFVLTILVGLLIYSLIVLPLILFVLTRRNPFAFIVSIVRACLMAFATSSSAAAIPDMLIACEEKNHIDKRVTRFVIPLCATLNRDGSALYVACAAVFVCQMMLGSISVTEAFMIWILTSVGSLAIPPVPSSSLVTLIIILTSLGIPSDGISLLFAIDWLMDRFRTYCNIISHTFCAAVTYQFCRKDLAKIDQADSHQENQIA
ncbi:excitatory amino acid transporter 1-like [Gigantopelta aegis]|uniref:excitatory amino acid transporter 1-like n=1 Tax=Gigantopelta aegis TaxID=1735272 RepID=UPI001B88B00F|nr:excitatory amino acid transporter 1-like [Gigantopelta aegis]